MNYKNKAIEIATNAASIALGLILFLAILIGVPAVFVGLYFAIKVAPLVYFHMTIHSEFFFYGFVIPAFVGLAWVCLRFGPGYLNKKNNGGDS